MTEPPSTAEEDAFEEAVEELMVNGKSEVDARAALRHCNGDLAKATKFIIEV